MPKAKETIKVEISEQTTEKMRTITVTMTGAAAEFMLGDLLHERGALESVSVPLKQAAREAVLGWLDTAEDLVKNIAASQKRAANGAKPKAKEPVNGNGNGASNGLHSAVMTAVPNEAAEDVLLLQ